MFREKCCTFEGRSTIRLRFVCLSCIYSVGWWWWQAIRTLNGQISCRHIPPTKENSKPHTTYLNGTYTNQRYSQNEISSKQRRLINRRMRCFVVRWSTLGGVGFLEHLLKLLKLIMWICIKILKFSSFLQNWLKTLRS